MLILTFDSFYFLFLKLFGFIKKIWLVNQKKKFQRYASNNLHKPPKCAPCQDIFLNIPQFNTLLYSYIHCNNFVFRGVVVFHKGIHQLLYFLILIQEHGLVLKACSRISSMFPWLDQVIFLLLVNETQFQLVNKSVSFFSFMSI